MENLCRRRPAAALAERIDGAAALAEPIFRPKAGAPAPPLCLHGTSFHIRVRDAVLRIPPGVLASYGDVAAAAGAPSVARETGAAIGRNPVSWLVPCYRVILANGYLHNAANRNTPICDSRSAAAVELPRRPPDRRLPGHVPPG